MTVTLALAFCSGVLFGSAALAIWAHLRRSAEVEDAEEEAEAPEEPERHDEAWHWASALSLAVDAGAPDDVQRALIYWLRMSLKVPGSADVLIEQALEAPEVASLGKK
jgi:hypothetical protein